MFATYKEYFWNLFRNIALNLTREGEKILSEDDQDNFLWNLSELKQNINLLKNLQICCLFHLLAWRGFSIKSNLLSLLFILGSGMNQIHLCPKLIG